MWRRYLSGGTSALSTCLRGRSFSAFPSASASVSATSNAVDSIILRSLKDHYLEISKMNPPPKINPPSSYTIVKGALDKDGPVLCRTYNDTEQISLSVMRLETLIPADADEEATGDNDSDDSINQLLLHVEVSTEGRAESLHFLCGLYPDAVGIHSVSLRPKIGKEIGEKVHAADLAKYHGRVFQELDPKIRDALHTYIEARGINEELFPFLKAWLYVKDHRKLMKWFKSIGTFISERNQA